jgi:hypothetical protein
MWCFIPFRCGRQQAIDWPWLQHAMCGLPGLKQQAIGTGSALPIANNAIAAKPMIRVVIILMSVSFSEGLISSVHSYATV